MNETVSINGLTLCHKNSDGFVRSTLPDVCKSPGAPVPYVNTAYAKTLADGTTTVRSHGGAMNGVLGSRFATSIGDEPGVGGGVISGVNMSEATFITFSPNVFMEGRAVTRLTDKMLLNKGNTVSMGGYYTGPLPPSPLLEEICFIACECAAVNNANQACVDAGLTAAHAGTNTPQDGVFPEARYIKSDGGWGLGLDPATGFPQRGGPFPHPDVTRISGGRIAEMVEVKFLNNGDRYRGNQQTRYDILAAAIGVQHKTLNFPEDCSCAEPKKKPVPVPASVPEEQEQPESKFSKAWHWAQEHPGYVAGGAVALVGIGAILFFSGGTAAPFIAAAAL